MKHALLLLLPSLVLALLGACNAQRPGPATEPGPGSAGEGSAAQAPARALEGTEWRLVEVGGRAAVAGSGARVAFLSFDAAASTLRGHSGVNTFFGPYALDGRELRVENLGMTRMAGPPELMAQESAFAAAVQAARSWRIQGDELSLLGADGVVVARLRAQDG